MPTTNRTSFYPSPPPTNPHDVVPFSINPQLPLEPWGEYDSIERHGEGGMGVVYKAHHQKLNRFEAVKLLRGGVSSSSQIAERFRFEAEATAALEHPNIVQVYGVGEVGGVPYFAMKWIDGGELTQRITEFQKNPRLIAGLLAKVARAVHHAHRQGILHRDLKPSNVLLDADGEPHVTDFGLAKQISPSEGSSRQELTLTGVTLGTPSYMSPEQARGDKRVTIAADVYGLGGILYELLTGRPPFSGTSQPDVICKVVTEPPVPPRAVNASANRDLEAICLKCLEKDPARRYPSAEAVAEDLDRFLAGEAVSVRPVGVWDWLVQVACRQPEYRQGYAWEVKLWFGVIMAIAQATIFGLVLAEVPILWVWGVLIAAWVLGAGVVHYHMGAKFTRLPETEKHSMMIAVGHIVAHVGLCIAYVPFVGAAAGVLAVYPAQATVSGLALFIIGLTHWGRFFLFGLLVMMLAPLLLLWPIASPLIYGGVIAASMWYWAYSVKVTFAHDQGETRE
ncbi:MAG TPA: serine/threonine-protein kinase [Gemmata sp.]|nr:serine/threonine-protein kinase [Gemmata sp.]